MPVCLARHPYIIRILVLLVSVCYPYFCALGGFPAIDEGLYAWITQLYHHNLASNEALAPTQGMALWPLLLAWIPSLPGLPLVWLRLADMIAALITGWLLCSIMERECGSLANVIAVVFLLCMNNYAVINNGFKNSIYPGWACLFGAISLIYNYYPVQKNVLWFCAGMLVSLGILLRETFFPFAFLGLFAAFRIGGMRRALCFSLGGIVLGILVFGIIELIAPGSLESLYRGYVGRRLVYQSQSQNVLPYFLRHGAGSLQLFAPALCLAFAIISWTLIFKKGKLFDPGKRWFFYFWLAVSFLPLCESLSKISFYYHFALMLPGMACLTAFFAGLPHFSMAEAWKMRPLPGAVLIAIGVLGLGSVCLRLPDMSAPARTLAVLHQLPHRRWPEFMIPQSTTLQVADLLNQALPAGGSVSSNCLTNFIYPASGFMPPLTGSFDPDDFNQLGDLGRFYLQTGHDGKRVLKALQDNPPDVIVLATALDEHEPCYSNELRKIILDSGQYEKFATVDPRLPNNYATNYAWFVYELYRHRSKK